MGGFSSCLTKKKLARLQAEYQILRTGMDSLGAVEVWEERKFRPGDKVFITIKTQTLNEQQLVFFDNGREMEFVVSNDSIVTLPLIGDVFVCRYNRPQLTMHIKQKVAEYIKEPFVSIRPVQVQVKVLGQVERQGLLIIPESDATLASLLAQVGGVSQFSKRDSVLVIREEEGLRKRYYVDIRDGNSFFNSPVYRLKQNDIVVVQPSDYFFKNYKNQENNINLGRITPIGTVIGVTLFLIQLLFMFNR